MVFDQHFSVKLEDGPDPSGFARRNDSRGRPIPLGEIGSRSERIRCMSMPKDSISDSTMKKRRSEMDLSRLRNVGRSGL